jgi:hypothetical protein
VKDVLVFEPEDLLENLTSCVANTSKEVKGTDRPILTLMFAHGNIETSSLTIGGGGEYKTCHKLTRDTFCEALLRHNPNPDVAVLTTMQYGGGWAQSSFSNISTTAVVDEEWELLSWPASRSINRCCGSRYAGTVSRAWIRNEISELDWEKEGYKIMESETYISLEGTIRKILAKEIDPRVNNQISFSAEDDLWGMERRERIGFPLSGFREKWEALKPISQADISREASIRFSDTITLSLPEARHRIQRLALDYMASNPGDSSAAKNHTVHSYCWRLSAGDTLTVYELENLAGSLQYRLSTIIDRATEYKDHLGLDFPDCRDCEMYTYEAAISKDKIRSARHNEIYKLFADYDLFDRPEDHEGMRYEKGNMYLISALTNSDRDRVRIKQALDTLTKLKSRLSTIELTLRHFRF